MKDYTDYLIDAYALPTPWVESPFFSAVCDNSGLSDVDRAHAAAYNRDGYLSIDLGLSDALIDGLKSDITASIHVAKKQESEYQYSESPRIFEAWKFSQHVREIACHPKIIELLGLLYARSPQPFQTINFLKGSNQPLHSDTIHFHTIPHRWVCGVWVALEDMDDSNGPLVFCPQSHKLPIYEFQDIGLPVAAYGKQFENYQTYEKFIEALVVAQELEVKPFECKKGRALIWAANLLHGGAVIMDPARTRWSQATHYYFPGCDKYYSPMFSDPQNGMYSLKDLSQKDIRSMHDADRLQLAHA